MVKNNIKILILSIAFSCCLSLASPVYADVTPLDRKGTCGYANEEGATKCCEFAFGSTLEKETSESTGVVSVVPDLIRDKVREIFSYLVPIFDNVPPLKELSKLKCTIGVPKQVGNSCTCTNEPVERLKASLDTVCKRNISGRLVLEKDPKLKEQLQREDAACKKCAIDEKGYYSSIGCIPSDLGEFISNFVLRIGIGIAGFISMLCIIYSAFLLQMSQGNPETVQKARDQITSCLIGLMMIIFSVFILRLIGVDILRIPGFS